IAKQTVAGPPLNMRGRKSTNSSLALQPRVAALPAPTSSPHNAAHRARASAPGTNGKHKPLSAAQAGALAKAEQNLGSIKSQAGVDLTEKVKELIRLAQDQGYLTFDDIHEALPESLATPDDQAEVYRMLGNLD